MDFTGHYEAGAFTKETAESLREAIVDDPLAQEAFALVRRAHQDEYAAVRHWEVLNLGARAAELVSEAEWEAAVAWLEAAVRLATSGADGLDSEAARFYQVGAGFLNDAAWETHKKQLSVLHSRWGEGATPNRGYDASLAHSERSVTALHLAQRGRRWAAASGSEKPAGSPLGTLHHKEPDIRVALDGTLAKERPAFTLPWAVATGWDDHGAWAELEVEGARQRLRWIEPGSFWMGSPEDEAGRHSDEGPRHWVTLTRGFWLFDTPVTQAFWQAVMGVNPSRFKGRRHPVENVSWNDAKDFLERMNQRFGKLGLRLPTEAEWEYACRAGTEGPRYGALDAIAWYGENSGDETHPVGEKEANPWGLSDMLGNVREWTSDAAYRHYTEGAIADPTHDVAPSDNRVLRGGSYFRVPGGVRAAYRDGNPPSDRNDNLGFRCASSELEGPEALGEPTARSEDASGGAAGGESGGTLGSPWLNAQRAASDGFAIPDVAHITLTSDCDVLTLDRAAPPDWASASGRDQHGLWADFTIEPKEADPVTTRMRWIAPGRFLMGSPEDEEGREDNEGPQQEVIISRGFWMMATPVTQGLWEGVMGNQPSRYKGRERPVETVNWFEAREFCETFPSFCDGLTLRLPTEAQWEYACRAGSTSARYGELESVAWYGESLERGATHDVGGKTPNAWGLFDTLGNVWEWVADAWKRRYDGERMVDPFHDGAPSGHRVLRGGSYFSDPGGVRAAYRSGYHPSDRFGLLGFRCASSELEEPEAQGRAAAAATPAREGGAAPKRRGAKDGPRPKGSRAWMDRVAANRKAARRKR